MDYLQEWWQEFQVHISLWQVLGFLVAVGGMMVLGRLGRYLMLRGAVRLHQRERRFQAAVLECLARTVVFVCFVIGLNLGIQFVWIPDGLKPLVATALSVLITVTVAYVLYWLVAVVDRTLTHLSSKTETKLDDMLVPMVRKSLRITIVVFALLRVAQTLSDKPLTSILAGLGLGGAALALASKDTIANFFGSLVLFTDKPFQMGDRIKVSGYDGIVEEVGFRSTRFRTLDGHLVTYPNGTIANLAIENISSRPFIKHVMEIGLTYDTPPGKMQEALDILNELLEDHEGMDAELPPRIYFNSFGDFSLNILVIYWFHPPDYWAYMAFNDRLNKSILERFNAAGLDFAFPSQTVYHAGDDSRPLTVGVRKVDTKTP